MLTLRRFGGRRVTSTPSSTMRPVVGASRSRRACAASSTCRSPRGRERSRTRRRAMRRSSGSTATARPKRLVTRRDAGSGRQASRHRPLSLFIWRMERSAQRPSTAVMTSSTVEMALISGDMPERSLAKISTGSVGS